MSPSTIPAAGSAAPSRLGMVATLIGGAVYCVALHLLIVDASMRAPALLLITAPWLLAGATTAASAGRRSMSGTTTIVVVGPVLAFAAWVVWRLGERLGERTDVLIFAENFVFLLSLAVLFGSTLLGDREALVTRLARITRRGDMTPAIVEYTRRVTAGWALFFATAAAISAALFALQSREVWSAFVNLALWPLTAAAFATEYLIRLRVLPDIAHESPLDGVRGFMRRDERRLDAPREPVR